MRDAGARRTAVVQHFHRSARLIRNGVEYVFVDRDVPRAVADLFVVGSHHEGSGYSLMEALACGVTPAVTDIPTFRLLTGGASVGTLWTPGHAKSCARGLRRP